MGYLKNWIFLSSFLARHDTFALGCWKWWYCMRGTSSAAWRRCWNCEQIWQNSIRNCFWQTFHRYLWNVAGKLFLLPKFATGLKCLNRHRSKNKRVTSAKIIHSSGTPRLLRPPRPRPCLNFGFQYALIRNNRSKNFGPCLAQIRCGGPDLVEEYMI